VKHVTLCFVIDPDEGRQVLLGLKKRGFGVGKWNGFGGKIEPDETPPQAASRELYEECGLRATPADLEPHGTLTFRFPHCKEYDHFVHVFLTHRWQGVPVETAEMRAVWYPVDALPFDAMWDDDKYWLPLVLQGKRLTAEFTYKPDSETVETAAIRALDETECRASAAPRRRSVPPGTRSGSRCVG
jgi:8-oxo-dGTP diphosphatase